jgi:hypothetical protein
MEMGPGFEPAGALQLARHEKRAGTTFPTLDMRQGVEP